jgi:uncharacterized protein YoxC
MYNSLQNQLSEINKQLSFILTSLTKLASDVSINNERLETSEANITDIVSTLLELTTNDSEPRQ